MKARDAGNLLVRLLDAVGAWVHLETSSGIHREGRLTGWTCVDLRINGVDLPFPKALELNGDPQDVVRLDQIISLTIDKKPD